MFCSKLSSNADQPSPIRPASRAPAGVSPPMMIAGGGVGDRERDGVIERVVRRSRVTGPPVHRARITAIASSSRAARSFASGNSIPYAWCSFGAPPIPIPSDVPSAARDLERGGHPGQERRVAVHHVGDERPDRRLAGHRGGHGEDRPALDDRDGPVAAAHEVVPRPDAGVARLVQAPGALEPPLRLRPDRADRDADRKAVRRCP